MPRLSSPCNTGPELFGSGRFAAVYSYLAFGERLECSFELPELVPAPNDAPTGWRIRTEEGLAPACACEPLGLDTVYATVQARAFAGDGVLRIVFDDTGTFDIRPDQRLIAWYPGRDVNQAAVRADLLGRVMAFAAHADGALALHASAVAVDDRAIAFLGPKHAGKSTLALSLVQQGARLLTDDTLVVRFDADGKAWAAPGVQRVRLWSDSARALGAKSSGFEGAKPVVDQLPERYLASDPVPLVACYVLHGSDADGQETPVQREMLSSIRAAIACVSFSKLGALAGGVASGPILDRATRLARACAVYSARVHRDLGRLDETAGAFITWHRVRAASPEAV